MKGESEVREEEIKGKWWENRVDKGVWVGEEEIWEWNDKKNE